LDKGERVHRELVDQAKRGDEEAFDALARMVGDRCMAIACRILRDSHLAEDAVQAALVVAWRELRTLRDPDRFEPWLHRILTHECYAEARRRTRWSANIRLLPVDGPSEAAGILAVNDRDQLERAFRRLSVEQRAVLVFHHYLGLPLPEVADRLGIPRGTAKSRLHHATAALRASVEADARTPGTTQERLA
jgi:RNA polymerase sigma-70 factor (ECF subfamily)